jgi:hypothetical protein
MLQVATRRVWGRLGTRTAGVVLAQRSRRAAQGCIPHGVYARAAVLQRRRERRRDQEGVAPAAQPRGPVGSQGLYPAFSSASGAAKALKEVPPIAQPVRREPGNQSTLACGIARLLPVPSSAVLGTPCADRVSPGRLRQSACQGLPGCGPTRAGDDRLSIVVAVRLQSAGRQRGVPDSGCAGSDASAQP